MNNGLGNKQIMSRNILKYMEIEGKTRQDVCRDLDISYTTFTDWVKGKTYPRIDKIEMLANYFHITKADLVEEESEPSKPGYYTDPETARLAQEMFEDPDMRILYSMKRDMDPQTFRDHMEFMRKAFLREHPERGDDFDGC